MSPKDSPTDEAPEVLIVESSPTQALKLRHLLTQQGFRAVSARDAREALASLDSRTPFLVLSDVVLPDLDGYELCRQIKANPHLSSVQVILLSSLSDPLAILSLLECGADNVLPKPYDDASLTSRINDVWGNWKRRRQADAFTVVYRGEERVLTAERGHERLDMLLSLFEIGATRELLLRQLRETVEQMNEERQQAAQSPATPPPLPTQSLRILLAEDSDVNQRLGVRTLEKYGHTVVVAVDGRQTLDALNGEIFDIILMDVEMPEMNGLDATAAIRERERASGAHIPIIAMTAHTDSETFSKCLAAGMDDCVSKPLQMETLAPIFAQLPSAPHTPSATVTWDRNAALATVEGDEELLGEIIGLFLEEAPRLLTGTRDAITREDSRALEQAAHSLKGSAASLGAGNVAATALALEILGRAGEADRATEGLRVLEAALADLTPLLEAQAE